MLQRVLNQWVWESQKSIKKVKEATSTELDRYFQVLNKVLWSTKQEVKIMLGTMANKGKESLNYWFTILTLFEAYVSIL